MFIKSSDGRNLGVSPDHEVKPQKFGNEEWLLNVF
jgi:hypothetical protein